VVEACGVEHQLQALCFTLPAARHGVRA
jgi:hypothetical protein